MFSSHSSFKFSLISSLILLTTACGGGGGGGSGTSISTPKVSADLLMEKYDGSTKSASLTSDDIYPTLQYLFEGDIDALSLSARKMQSLQANGARSKEVGARASETQSCAYGGSQTISENLNQETGVGKLQVSYNNCDDGSGVLSGRVVTDYHKWDLSSYEPVNFDIYYEELRYQIGAEFTLLNGMVKVTGANTCEELVNSNMLLETDKISILDKDLKVTTQSCIDEYNQQLISGRIYFSDKGYLDLVTPEPIVLDFEDNLLSGGLTITSEHSEIVLNANNSYVQVSVDSNRDGAFELETNVPSWYLNDQSYSDIADDDDDGIPNSWESVNGLDPQISNEGTDSDLDGFTDYYEFLANSDPNSNYSFPLFYLSMSVDTYQMYVGAPTEVNVYLAGNIEPGLLSAMSDISISIPLPSPHTWSVNSSPYGCTIEDGTTATQVLICPHVDLSNFPNHYRDDLFVSLTLTANQANTIVAQAQIDIDFPFDQHGFGFELYPKRSDLAFWTSDIYSGYVLDTLEDGFSHSILLNQDTREYMSIDKANVLGTLVDNQIGVTITSVTTEYSSARCSVNASGFSCYDVDSWDPINVQFSKPTEQGKVEFNLEVNTVYPHNVVQTTAATMDFSFGQDMSVLQAIVDQAPDSEVLVEPGIYLGNLSINKPMALTANGNVELWLQSPIIDYSAFPAIRSSEYLSLDGFDVYLDQENIEFESGALRNNKFYFDEHSGEIVYTRGDLLFLSNKVLNSSGGGQYYNLGLIRSNRDTVIDNNLFSFALDSHVALWRGNGANSNNAIIRNNTIVNVPSIVDYASDTPVIFKNNLVVSYTGPLYNDEYFLRYVSDENNILPNRYSEYANANNIFTDTPGIDPEDSYRLLPDSIAIDNGLDLSDSITTDLDGNARPSGSAFDIGAYEYQH
ncbi:right-handed parallel beta-helix repeat-containing protein [Agarivorans albus]|uniref:Right handed beta helix domain-containing protein n=1 Tax=Agarivorans albus MKT 106 TaxID=1331007 RepID=R9PIM0_AGAAL|nr:right-handed parallel beta-helix repeat-containing protein [Agarivorans albus]GAD01229.1 hypothetical protein AALB_1309 [Agarivorans albus MKT 106]